MRPEPEEHSGHLRLQIFVSSALIDTGIPMTSGLPVTELFRYEYPARKAFAGLTKYRIIKNNNNEVR